jgi:hypothetical protein
MLDRPQKPVKLVKLSKKEQRRELERQKEERMKEDRIKDMLLLLENLFEREEATAKIIIDCLYDLGSVNLINNHIPQRPINKLLKAIAGLPKPAVKIVGLWWFKKNCPRLIVEWLVKDIVSFKKKNKVRTSRKSF